MKVFIQLANEETATTKSTRNMVVAAAELCLHKITENCQEAELMITDSPVIGAELLQKNPKATLIVYIFFSCQDSEPMSLARKFPGRVEICPFYYNAFGRGRKPLVVRLEELGENKWLRGKEIGSDGC